MAKYSTGRNTEPETTDDEQLSKRDALAAISDRLTQLERAAGIENTEDKQ